MAKKRSFRRSPRKFPLAVLAGLFYGFTTPIYYGSVYSDIQRGDYESAGKQVITGLGFNAFDNKIDLGRAKILHGLLIGAVISYVASRLGINRKLAGLPIISI